MQVAFYSSHTAGDFSSGELVIHISLEDKQTGYSRIGRVQFSIPTDYHVHNDCVAAALMTLVGRMCRAVKFNFPISQRCADLLTSFYGLDSIEPVDTSLEPRQPGRYLAINFSGGIDSTGLYLLLDEALGSDFRVISYDFGGRFERERSGFELFRRDITCCTDLRKKGFDRYGRFLASAALLYADYLDLRSVASGHTLHNERITLASIVDGVVPNYRHLDGAYHAGGLVEEHLVRGLASPGMFKIILDRAPERMETALAASAPRNTEKYYTRAIWSKHVYRQVGLPLPDWMVTLKPPTGQWQHIPGQRYTLFTLWAMKYEGVEEARRVTPEIDQYNMSFLQDVSLLFTTKYNTNVTSLLPDDLAPALLRAFHNHDIYPYTERDWQELDIVRRELFTF